MNPALWLLASCIFFFFISIYFFLKARKIKGTAKRVDEWYENESTLERKSFVLVIGDKFDQSELAKDLQRKLIQANLSLKPSEYQGIYILLLALMTFIFNQFLGLYIVMSLLIALIMIAVGSKFFLKSRKNKRTESFEKQLPEICRMMSNGIKAGQTIPQAIQMVGRDMDAPSGPEFKKMHNQFTLGDSLEVVMNDFRERLMSNDINIFVSTILIQQRVGGNLAEVLSTMAETLEERSRVHKEIRTVTAESQTIAYILVAMPFLMMLMMNLFIKGFLNVIFTPFGLLLFVGFSSLVFMAFLLIRRLTNIRV